MPSAFKAPHSLTHGLNGNGSLLPSGTAVRTTVRRDAGGYACPLAGQSFQGCGSHSRCLRGRVSASPQLVLPTLPTLPGSSAASLEPLRPTRLSAPVIARLIRSTTNIQELADVVAQQSPFFDSSHLGVALLHLALLTGRQRAQQAASLQQQQQQQQQLQRQLEQQQQQQQQRPAAASTGASAAADAAPGPSGFGASGSGGSSSSGNSSPGRDAATGTAGPVGLEAAYPGAVRQGADSDSDPKVGSSAAGLMEDSEAEEPLVMSSILDDDEEEEAVNGGFDDRSITGSSSSSSSGSGGGGAGAAAAAGGDGASGAGSGSGALGGGRGAAGGARTAAAQSAELLDAAVADAPAPTRLGEPDPDAPPRVVAASAATGVAADGDGAGGSRAAGSSPLAGTPQQQEAASNAAGPGTSTSGAGPGAAARSPAAAALRTLLSCVFSKLDSMSGSDLASVVSALAALRFPDKAVAEQLVLALSTRLRECTAKELPNVMCSAALLGVQPDPEFRNSFYRAVRSQVRRFGPRELASTLWAYGAVRTDVQEDAVTVLLDNSRSKLTSFSPLLLVKMAQGLAALRYRPPAEWVEAYSAALRPSLRRFSSRELCALLLALASLQIGLEAPARATLLVHTLSVLPSLAPSELALSIAALGRLTSGGSSGPALLDLDMSGRLLEVTAAALRGGAFSGGELQALLEGLTRLALQPPLQWMQDYVAALQPRLRELDARQLAGVLGSLAAQQYRPEPEMQAVVLEATQANMTQLLSDTTCTASLVTALRRLSIEPPPSWVEALLAASRSALKNRCTDLHLANLAASLAAWGVQPDGRWTARLMWRSTTLMSQNRMSPRALVALLQAMSSLGLRPTGAWTALCLRAALQRASQRAFEPHHLSTLMTSLHALGIQPQQEWLVRMLLATYACWDRFGVSTWSSLLPSLVLLQARPPRSWLARFESTSAPRLADCSALQLLSLLVSLYQLHQLAAAGAVITAGAPPAASTAGGAASEQPPPPPASLPLSSAARLAASARPGGAWQSHWWSASAGLLGRMRYAPSELVLTASWLASLGLRPPPEWLQACGDVAARYAKVMDPAEQQQLAAALLPLLGPAPGTGTETAPSGKGLGQGTAETAAHGQG